MWLFTIYGFFSIACAKKEGSWENDPSRIMVRARLRSHLEALKTRFPQDLGAVEIVKNDETDYGYRIILPKAVWLECLYEIGQEQTWSNFKSEVAKIKGNIKSGYEHALHAVWSTMFRLQLEERRSTAKPLKGQEIGRGNRRPGLVERSTYLPK